MLKQTSKRLNQNSSRFDNLALGLKRELSKNLRDLHELIIEYNKENNELKREVRRAIALNVVLKTEIETLKTKLDFIKIRATYKHNENDRETESDNHDKNDQKDIIVVDDGGRANLLDGDNKRKWNKNIIF